MNKQATYSCKINICMMRFLVFLLCLQCPFNTKAAGNELLVRALSCQLTDTEIGPLIKNLITELKEFGKASTMLALPSVNVYQLTNPVTANGYTSTTVAIMPTRILLAVPGKTIKQAQSALKLESVPFSPVSRSIRPTVNLVALELSHKELAHKLLVGCEYANQEAAKWAGADEMLPP